jgi:diadenosine tetraphosphatase ApaH/serine/threonine PP2A family protein phosphatase
VHSNLPALDAVLRAAAPYDALWHLGDIVGYGPQPNEVVARLAAEGAVGVRGNHDAAAIGQLSAEAFNDDARTAIEWTAGRLDAASRAWLAGLPERHQFDDFTLVHGSPRDPTWEYVFSASTARGNLSAFGTFHCLLGHTHVPLCFRLEGRRIETLLPDERPLELDRRRRTLLNPGSVGQPRDGDPRASALVLDTERATVEWLRVEYDIAAVQRLMRAAALPRRLARRLDFGL